MAYNGHLNANHIQSALFNMIIAQDIIGGSIHANYNIVDKAKEQAGLYGDTVLKIDTPVLTKNFAGIGTRKLNDKGWMAIKEVCIKTFEH